ncbi:hypothetical protein C8J56DRAFT_789023 [Mycena floridula]|nr:hypothetical protein C8J56DRAFT_789023 [Mycena floridula]
MVDDCQENFIVGAVDALKHIQDKMHDIISLMESHQITANDFIVCAGFNESLIMRGVGHLQQIFVFLSLDSTPDPELLRSLGKILSPYPALVHTAQSQMVPTPVFQDNTEQWDFDDLVLSRVERFEHSPSIPSSDPADMETLQVDEGAPSGHASSFPSSSRSSSGSSGSRHGSNNGRDNTGDDNNINRNPGDGQEGNDDGDGPGGGSPDPGPPSVLLDSQPRAFFRATADISCRNSSKQFQKLETQGVVVTMVIISQFVTSQCLTLTKCCVQVLELNFQSKPVTAFATSAYQQCFAHVTFDATSGDHARTLNRHPKSTRDFDPTIKETTSQEIGWIGQLGAAGKGLFSIPSLELTGSMSRTTKGVTGSEKMRKTSWITQHHSGGDISWRFTVTDPHFQQNGLEFPDEDLPSVEFEMLGVPLPDTVFVEVASYWTIPFPTKRMWSSGTSREPLFQNICHVVAMGLPSKLTQSSNYVANLQKGLRHDKLEKTVEQGSPQVLPAILRFEPGDNDHMHQIDTGKILGRV